MPDKWAGEKCIKTYREVQASKSRVCDSVIMYKKQYLIYTGAGALGYLSEKF